MNFELISFEKKIDIRYFGDEDSLIERLEDLR